MTVLSADVEVCPTCGREETCDFHEDDDHGYRACLNCNQMWALYPERW